MRGRERYVWRRPQVGGRSSLVADTVQPGDVTIVFIHGFACTPRYANYRTMRRLLQMPEFGEVNCRIVAPVLPGFAGTPPLPSDDSDFDSYARWCAECLDDLDVDGPLVLVGESMGGAVALTLAALEPERIGSVVVFNSVGGAIAGRRRRDWVKGLLVGISRRAGTLGQWHASVLDALLTAVHPVANWRASTLVVNADVRPALAAVKRYRVPVVAVFGKRDTVVPHASSAVFADELGIQPLFIDSDHRAFIDGHPAIATLVVELARAVSEKKPLPVDPAPTIATTLRRQCGVEVTMGVEK